MLLDSVGISPTRFHECKHGNLPSNCVTRGVRCAHSLQLKNTISERRQLFASMAVSSTLQRQACQESLRDTLLQYCWPIVASLAVLYCLTKVVAFLRADADLRLLAKRKLNQNAFVDKVVWITGASQGLGEELAKQFSIQGAYLILSSRNTQRLQAVKASLRGKHAHEAVVLPLDITSSYADLKQAAEQADKAFGSEDSAEGIDILVQNAGASQRSPAEDASAEVVDSLYELNVLGTLRLTRAMLPLFLGRASNKNVCRFVVVGSMAAVMPAPGQAAYAACKASLAAYFCSLHSELWTRGVRVTLCHPGPIATGVAGQVRSLYGSSSLLTEVEDPSAVKQRQSPARVAELILLATYHGLDCCWISSHPILLMAYLVQYWPSLGYWVLNKVGPARANSYRTGGSGYDISMLTKGGSKSD